MTICGKPILAGEAAACSPFCDAVVTEGGACQEQSAWALRLTVGDAAGHSTLSLGCWVCMGGAQQLTFGQQCLTGPYQG